MSPHTPPGSRRHDLDALRAAAMLLGLVYHAALSFAADIFSTAIGAQRVGASRKALWGTVIGTFAGLFFMPIGLLAGPFNGALAGELWHGRDVGQAAKVGLGTWLGIFLQRFSASASLFSNVIDFVIDVKQIDLIMIRFGFYFALKMNLGTLIGAVAGIVASR